MRVKNRKKPSYQWIAVLVLVLLFSGCDKVGPPIIELNVNYFDMGDINPAEGIRKEIFYVKNRGNTPLTIRSVSTSCGCTEAEVESKKIMPGGQTKLIVTYDPSVHPGLVGKMKRVVYIQSDDPLQEEIELELIGNMVPSS